MWEKDVSRALLFTCSPLEILAVVLHSFKICAELKEREACYPVQRLTAAACLSRQSWR